MTGRRKTTKRPTIIDGPIYEKLKMGWTTYWLCELYTEKSLFINGDIAASNAIGHSSWGR